MIGLRENQGWEFEVGDGARRRRVRKVRVSEASR